MKKCTVAVLAGTVLSVLSAIAVAADGTPPQSSRPVAFVSEPGFNFAPVLEGEVVTHTFTVRNTGTAPLIIQRVKASCGCTTADYTRQIDPGGQGGVTLNLRTKGYGGGTVVKSATVFTNDPSAKNIRLHLTGRVDRLAEITPEIVRFVGPVGDISPTVVVISPSDAHPFEIVGLPVTTTENVRCKIEPHAGEYRLTVENMKETEGKYFGTITLSTNHPKQPAITIRVVGDIRSAAGDGAQAQ